MSTSVYLARALDALSMHGFRPSDGFDGEDWDALSGPREALALIGRPGVAIRLADSRGDSVVLQVCEEGGVEEYSCSSDGAEHLVDCALWSAQQ